MHEYQRKSLLNEYLISTCYVQSTVLGIENTVVTRMVFASKAVVEQ